MRFVLLGGDKRQLEIAGILSKSGHSVCLFGLPEISGYDTAESLCDAVAYSDIAVLPVPVSRDGITLNAPLSRQIIYLEDMTRCLPPVIFGGVISEEIEKTFQSGGISCYDYMKSEKLTLQNAVLTAEAAVALCINGSGRAVFGSKSLIIGYGRIGKQLARCLKALGSDITVSSRNPVTKLKIEIDGYIPADTKGINKLCDQFDYIFNTAPAPVMDSAFFTACKPTVFVSDLATDAGTDFAAAAAYGINAQSYGGLPGKFSPVTAAGYIAEEILGTIKSDFHESGG